jgi:hypothetical protein
MKPVRVKSRFKVMVEVEAEGHMESDLEEAERRLKNEGRAQFPSFNMSCIGSAGSYHIKCLGVRKVTRVKETK